MSGRSLRLAGHILIGAILAGPVLLLRQKGHGNNITRWWMRALARVLRLRIRIRGGQPGRPALWCSNHVSWLDVVVLGAVAELSFLSKAEVPGWPLVGRMAQAAGTIFLKRGAGQTRDASRIIDRRLRQGGSVVIFPEGTTSDGRCVRKLYPRLFGAAITAGVPIQPTALHFSERGRPSTLAPFVGDNAFLDHLFRLLKQGKENTFIIRLMPSIEPNGLDRRSLAHAVRAIIQSGLDELDERPVYIENELPTVDRAMPGEYRYPDTLAP